MLLDHKEQESIVATSILVEPTITKLSPAAMGSVIICGSHGGRYPGYAAAKAHVRAVIFNDAGVGLQEAGIGSLAYLDALGIGAATVSYMSCRIGDADDMRRRGTISYFNRVAAAVGVEVGTACQKAAELLRDVSHIVSAPSLLGESRSVVDTQDGSKRIVLIDSAALVS